MLSPSLSHRPRRPAAALLSALILGALGLLAAGSGCGGPEPFVPKDACASLTGCEVCASRGGCAWCASACVAAEGAQCSSALVQAPNQCPGAAPAQ